MLGRLRVYSLYLIMLLVGVLVFLLFIFLAEYGEDLHTASADSLESPPRVIHRDSHTLGRPQRPAPSVESTAPNASNADSTSRDSTPQIPQDSPNTQNPPQIPADSAPSTQIPSVEIPRDSTPPRAFGEKPYLVINQIANVRESPTTKSAVIAQYAQGERVAITAIYNHNANMWGRVKGGGFVYMPLLEAESSGVSLPIADIQAFIVTARAANVRESADINAQVIGKIPQDSRVFITNIAQDWGELLDGGFVYMGILAQEPES